MDGDLPHLAQVVLLGARERRWLDGLEVMSSRRIDRSFALIRALPPVSWARRWSPLCAFIARRVALWGDGARVGLSNEMSGAALRRPAASRP